MADDIVVDDIAPGPKPFDQAPARDIPVSKNVDTLLTQSRAAHAAYREAMTRNDLIAARTSLQEAHDTRVAAQAADPTFTSPIWGAHDGSHPHRELVKFYEEQLAR